jgi:hypothetical protein
MPRPRNKGTAAAVAIGAAVVGQHGVGITHQADASLLAQAQTAWANARFHSRPLLTPPCQPSRNDHCWGKEVVLGGGYYDGGGTIMYSPADAVSTHSNKHFVDEEMWYTESPSTHNNDPFIGTGFLLGSTTNLTFGRGVFDERNNAAGYNAFWAGITFHHYSSYVRNRVYDGTSAHELDVVNTRYNKSGVQQSYTWTGVINNDTASLGPLVMSWGVEADWAGTGTSLAASVHHNYTPYGGNAMTLSVKTTSHGWADAGSAQTLETGAQYWGTSIRSISPCHQDLYSPYDKLSAGIYTT